MGSRTLDEMEAPIEEWEVLKFVINYKSKVGKSEVFEVEHSIYGTFESILMMEIEELYFTKEVENIEGVEIYRRVWVLDDKETTLAKKIIEENLETISKFSNEKVWSEETIKNAEKQTLLALLEKYKADEEVKQWKNTQ